NRFADRLHAPELDDLGAPTRLVGQRTEEFMDGHAVSGFFQHLAARRGHGILAGRKLSLRKPPCAQFARLDNGELWSAIVAQHNSSSRQNRYARLNLTLLHCTRSTCRELLAGIPGVRGFVTHLDCCAPVPPAQTLRLPSLCDAQVTSDELL